MAEYGSTSLEALDNASYGGHDNFSTQYEIEQNQYNTLSQETTDNIQDYDAYAEQIISQPMAEFSRMDDSNVGGTDLTTEQMGRARMEGNSEIQQLIDPSTQDLANRINSQLKEGFDPRYENPSAAPDDEQRGLDEHANLMASVTTNHTDERGVVSTDDSLETENAKLRSELKSIRAQLDEILSIDETKNKRGLRLLVTDNDRIYRGILLVSILIAMNASINIFPKFKSFCSFGTGKDKMIPIITSIFGSIVYMMACELGAL